VSFEVDAHAGRDSLVHRWDPRAKIVGLGALILAIALNQHHLAATIGLVLAAAAALIARLPVRWTLRRLRPVFLVLALFLVILPFTGGPLTSSLGPVPYSMRGLYLAILLLYKGIAIATLALVMFGTARFDRSMRALERLRVPRRLVELTLFTYRYLFVLSADLARMRMGLRAQGYTPGLSPHALATSANLVGVVLVRSFERTERIGRAMVARGYAGTVPTLETFEMKAADVAKTALAVAPAAGIAFLDYLDRVG